MDIKNISSGKNVPDTFNVIIEIPCHGEPVKYEIDKDSGALMVDRFMGTAMYYPTNYGFIPNTLSDDGDPADVLVKTPVPLISGSVISCRPVGMLTMTDESGEDAKILAVPTDDLCKDYRNVHTPEDMSPHLLSTISHFFEHYKDLEEGKWVKIGDWVGPEEAKKEIMASIERYEAECHK